ncbi:NACHT domain-containing protein [Nonomuraea sp. NPDC049486]|uniref:NACHT domain-containing protein n=1 Tax=Nonomuraea sp. NPDC049486 TaxID=3155773 RepID=UPI0034195FB0
MGAATTLVTVVILSLRWVTWSGNDSEAHPLDFIAILLTALSLVGTAAGIWMTYRLSSGPSDVTDVKAAARTLVNHVQQQWSKESAIRQVDDPHPMPVRWRLTADRALMSPRHLIASEDVIFDGHSSDIAQLVCQFRALKRRRLVIVGGPGTGKTTLAIQLLQRLLATRDADQAAALPGEVIPVPVLLPVSGWDTNTHPQLQDWLADRLARDYPALKAPELGPDAAAALVRSGHILPILDGLDETGQAHRARVVAALNMSLSEHDQLILTSRTAEFRAVVNQGGRPLTAAAVIAPQALSRQDAANYLRDCMPESPAPAWQQLLHAITQGTAPELARLAVIPLWLWLIRIVYLTPSPTHPRPVDPNHLTGPLGHDAEALRTHLLDRVIPAIIAARALSSHSTDHFRPRHCWNPQDVHRYLTFLALIFPPTQTRDITWWRIPHATPHIRSTLGLAFGLIFALVFGLVGFLSGLEFGFIKAFVNGVAIGLLAFVVELVAELMKSKRWLDTTPRSADLNVRGRLRLLFRSVSGPIIVGLAAALTADLATTLTFVYASGIDLFSDILETENPEYFAYHLTDLLAFFGGGSWAEIGLVVGLALGLVVGLLRWAEQTSLASTTTPRSSWHADRRLMLFRTLVVGAAFGLVGGAAGGLGLGPGFARGAGLGAGLVSGLTMGLLGGLMFGITAGTHRAWLVSTIAAARQAAAGRLPLRVMDFLDDAHRLGLLRAVGPVYQFRHAALHDYLAAGGSERREGMQPP